MATKIGIIGDGNVGGALARGLKRVGHDVMLGADAGEVIAVVQTAMLAGLPYTGLRDCIFTHPTMAEGLNVLFSNVPSSERNSP